MGWARLCVLVCCLACGVGASAAEAAQGGVDDGGVGTKVCVTGGSGFLAVELVAKLLDRGFQVTATVRDPSNSAKTEALWALPGAAERLTLVGADLLQPGAFQPCAEGARYLFHTASPFVTKDITDPVKQLVEPAVNGTRNVLASALQAGVKRVVLTSSIAAVFAGRPKPDGGGCFHEDDWNTQSTLESHGLDQYRLSKTLAERAAWEMVEGQSMELATINPSFIIGPPRTRRVDSESLENMKVLLEGGMPPRGDTPVADVRDCARAHIAAALTPDAGGKRFIVSSAKPMQRAVVVKVVRDAFPELDIVAESGVITDPASLPNMFCSRTLQSLGMDPLTSPETSIRDMAAAMISLGSTLPKYRKPQEPASTSRGNGRKVAEGEL